MIKNIILDVGRVLVHWDPVAGLRSLGYDEKTVNAVNDGIVESGLWDLEDEGKLSGEEILRTFIDAMPEYKTAITDFWNNLDKSIWAYSNLGSADKAVSYYQKAASKDDGQYAAGYLLKAGIASEAAGNAQAALKFYKQIELNYPNTLEGYDIQKYISRIENK